MVYIAYVSMVYFSPRSTRSIRFIILGGLRDLRGKIIPSFLVTKTVLSISMPKPFFGFQPKIKLHKYLNCHIKWEGSNAGSQQGQNRNVHKKLCAMHIFQSTLSYFNVL